MTVDELNVQSSGRAGPVYLVAVLVVLEACVVVHEAVQFLKALVLLLRLQHET